MTHVFISYSHDSEAHRAFVLQLANRLRADGLTCEIDQYINGFPAEGWQRWMEMQIEQADFVLLVCTENYLKRYRGQDTVGGRGVNFEGLVISQTLYDAYYRNTKFIPVLPEGGSFDHVPLPLKQFSVFTLMREYEPLYRVLTAQPEVAVPEIGYNKILPPKAIAEIPDLLTTVAGVSSFTIHYQKSEAYLYLIDQRSKLRERIKKYPTDSVFPKYLADIEGKIKSFERDVLQLAEAINNISPTSERLKQAADYFAAGEFGKVQAVLDIKELTQEQESLIKQKDSVQRKLEVNAQELVVLAQATAVAYQLGEQRIPTTQSYFEQALISDRSADNLFLYARLLQENKQFKLAEKIYREVLNISCDLAQSNPMVYSKFL